jgi:hypothetical protein
MVGWWPRYRWSSTPELPAIVTGLSAELVSACCADGVSDAQDDAGSGSTMVCALLSTRERMRMRVRSER